MYWLSTVNWSENVEFCSAKPGWPNPMGGQKDKEFFFSIVGTRVVKSKGRAEGHGFFFSIAGIYQIVLNPAFVRYRASFVLEITKHSQPIKMWHVARKNTKTSTKADDGPNVTQQTSSLDATIGGRTPSLPFCHGSPSHQTTIQVGDGCVQIS